MASSPLVLELFPADSEAESERTQRRAFTNSVGGFAATVANDGAPKDRRPRADGQAISRSFVIPRVAQAAALLRERAGVHLGIRPLWASKQRRAHRVDAIRLGGGAGRWLSSRPLAESLHPSQQ
jgi:hypothetical protein